MTKFKIVGATYGRLAVIPAASASEALTLFLSWFTDGRLVRDDETHAHYIEDDEQVSVTK